MSAARMALPDGAYSRATSALSATSRVARACTGFITPAAVDQSLVEIRQARADLVALAKDLKTLRPHGRANRKEQTQ